MAFEVFDLFVKIGADISGVEQAFGKVKGLGSGLASAAKIGAAAISAATTAVVAFGKTSVDAGKEFDSSMSQVAATMGLTMDEMATQTGKASTSFGEFEGNLRDFAQFMGKNTAFSASEAADALNYMALAGYSVQESMDMLPNVLSLAAAGDFDLARASDMVTDTQTAFGISAERTTQMVDEMAKAASTGNTSVEQLGDAFLVVGGLAQELNGGMVKLDDGTEVAVDGIQELEIALTAMANAGVKGSEAGTHMRNMLLKLSDPTDDGTKALESMGVAIFDTEGQMRSLADIFGDMSVAMEDMSQEEKISTIAALFNTRDIASAEALLNAVGQDWDEIGASILEAEGAASQMAETQLDNLAGDITLFKSALEGAQIVISDQLTPNLREFVQFGTEGLQRLTDAFKTGGLEKAMNELGELIGEGLKKIIKKLPDAIKAGAELLKSVAKGIMDNMDGLLEAIVEIVSYLGTTLLENLEPMFDAMLELVLKLADFLIENLPEMVPAIVEIVLKIVDVLTQPETLEKLVEAALQIMIALMDGILKAIPKVMEAVPKIIENFVKAITNLAPKILSAGGEILLKLGEGLLMEIAGWIAIAAQLPMDLINGIAEYFQSLLETGKKIGQKIKDGFWEFVEAAKQWGADLIQNFIDGLFQKWEDLKKGVADIAGTIADYLHFSEPDKGPLSDFHTYAPDMMKLFAEGIEDNKRLITDAVEDSFNLEPTIQASYATSAKNTMTSDGNLVAAIVQALRQVAPELSKTIKIEGNRDRIVDIVVEENERSIYSMGRGLLET